jgi:hypothetical protein
LNNSAAHTRPIAIAIKLHCDKSKRKHTPTPTARIVATLWIQAFLSVRKKKQTPRNAYTKLRKYACIFTNERGLKVKSNPRKPDSYYAASRKRIAVLELDAFVVRCCCTNVDTPQALSQRVHYIRFVCKGLQCYALSSYFFSHGSYGMIA